MQGHEWLDQQDLPVSNEEEGVWQYGPSEGVMPLGRQMDRIFMPVDVQRGANEAQEEANEAQEETVQ